MKTIINIQMTNGQGGSRTNCGECKASWKPSLQGIQECPACGSDKAIGDMGGANIDYLSSTVSVG